MKIELYINKQLADIGNPEKFSVTLKRQLYNPSELNTKDAQVSYRLALPASTVNNRIFGFVNVEEVRGKFERLHDAQLIVNGIRIFDGKFRLSEIDSREYRGNLGIPAPKTIKEIFGDTKMNEAGEWKIDFTGFAESIRHWNNKPDAPCIFPYVLYGLLPKVLSSTYDYTPKDVWDDTVRLGVDDFAPSVNCMQFIEQLFAGQKLKLGGTALDDVRLRKLYMSYKNPTEYQMPWNYGELGKVALSVEWSNYRDRNKEKSLEIERTMVQNRNPKSSPTGAVYNADLLSAVNSRVQIRDNPGENIRKVEVLRYADRPFTAYRIFIPYSGLYKIRLSGSIALYTPYLSGNFVLRSRADGKDIRVIQPSNNNLAHWRYELKLIRDGGKGDFNLESCDIDREFYKDNINQTSRGEETEEVYPKYFPHGGELCYIDPAQNPNLLCGLSFGKDRNRPNPYVAHLNTPPEKSCSNAIAIKGGLSWNHEVDRMVVAATASRGYGECYRDEDDQIAYEESERFKVDLQNCPGENTATTDAFWTQGEGSVYQIAWLDKGECITLLASCDQSKNEKNWHGAAMQNIEADLEIEAYRSDEDWVLTKINADGESLPGTTMDWEDKSNLETEKINLMKFLPSDITIDSWLENFCKAFNLKLTQDDKGNFGLDTAPDGTQYGGYVIDLDSKTHVNRERTNSSLNLPSAYQISFNIDTDEEGYVRRVEKDDDGSGQIDTGNAEGKPFAQHSSFSYNWFKNIKIAKYDNKEYRLPVISKHEVWKLEESHDYAAMMKKYYSNQPQRFWYKGDNLEVSGFGDAPVETTLVRNDLPQLAELTYRDQSLSILNNYFTILAKNNSNYTEVKCILAADEYARLAESLVLYNGDLYYPAEIDGYDPLGKSAATLKLIRKIN